jgi:FtsP/CotA-like multicopper oxidase with cupredoxin domain
MNRIKLASPALIALALACQPPVSDGPEVKDPPMPEILGGLNPAEDHDPAPDVVEYHMDVSVAQHELLEGVPVEVLAYNGEVPGPLLQARVGDTMRMVVTNNLNEATTIHWHGLRIPVEMDGVVHGSVLAIEPGETFTYEFIVPDAGTYWYHPHVRSEVQIERGLHGMLIVHEAEADAPEVDADRAFVLDDVRLNQDGTIAAFGANHMDVMHGRTGNVLLVNGSDAVPSMELGENQVERWRLVNTANGRTMTVQFPGLEVREIGADAGLWPQSLTRVVDRVVLPVGARAELEVRLAPGATEASLESVVLALDENDEVIELPIEIVHVAHDAALDKDEALGGHVANPSFDFISPELPLTHRIELTGVNGPRGVEMQVNGASFPNVPIWEVPQGQLQIVEIENKIGPEHPFHLHGQFFQVLSRDGRYAPDVGWRDTTYLGGFQKVVIATYFENVGDWMYHCHVLEHAEAGMMALVRVNAAD